MPYYNHNDHYASMVLRQAPRPCRRTLDIGCGEGRLLAKLADVSEGVVGIDPDATSIVAAGRSAPAGVELIQGEFLDHDFGEHHFDFITAVASLHHMPLDSAFRKMAALLRPGGVIAVVGLYRQATITDRLVQFAAIPVNAALAWSRPSSPMSAPAINPTEPLRDIRTTAAQLLPGAKTRRLLLWRYCMTWTKPTTVSKRFLGESPAEVLRARRDSNPQPSDP